MPTAVLSAFRVKGWGGNRLLIQRLGFYCESPGRKRFRPSCRLTLVQDVAHSLRAEAALQMRTADRRGVLKGRSRPPEESRTRVWMDNRMGDERMLGAVRV